jgi:hypothetical protein
MVDMDLLVANPRNPNKHPDSQIKLLAKIMAHQGWRSPIVVSNRSGFITKGHGRLMASRLNGWTSAPVDRQDYANEADEYADMVADNKIQELSETDNSAVIAAIKEMPDIDLELLGYDDITFLNPNIAPMDLSETFEEPKKFVLEIQFPNDMEMMDIHDDLLSRGYMVKVK